MDIPRTRSRLTGRRKVVFAVILGLLASGVAAGVQFEPAAPSVELASLWVDSVRVGPLVRQVRGPGTLVPEQTRYVSALTPGRVERLLVEPGSGVEPETVLLRLANPEVELEAMEARRQLAATEASLANLRAGLENQRLSQQATVATTRAQYNEAARQAEAHRELAREGITPRLHLQRLEESAEEWKERLSIEERRLVLLTESMEAQVTAHRSEVERLRALVGLREDYVRSLTVEAGVSGVLRELPLEEGEWVDPGRRLAVVVRPDRLKAQIRIPETQVKDIMLGQRASIDTRNGHIPGRVVRIDPAVENGAVTVDVALNGDLPRGTRPDLSIDGTIELEKLDDVLYTGRPVFGNAESSMGIFKLDPDGKYARRTTVRVGRTSVNAIEIVSGLAPGDVVILSDMSAWDGFERVRLK